MRILVTFFFLMAVVPAFAQWAKKVGGTSAEYANSITYDSDGNVYLCGNFSGTADFDPDAGTTNLTSAGGYDIFFAKFNSSGALVWANRIGGTDYDEPTGIAVDGSGNVYLGGLFNGTVDFDPGAGTTELVSAGGNDIFFAKYNSSGELSWAKRMGNSGNDGSYSLKLDGSNNVIISGWFSNTVDFDPGAGTTNLTAAGSSDAFFAKYDNNGDITLAKNVGGTGYDQAYSVAVDGSGNIYIAGNFTGTADFDPGAGTTNLTSGGSSYDIFFAKYNSSGELTWAKNIGGEIYQELKGMTIDASGNVYIIGYFEDIIDFDPGAGSTNLTSNGSEDVFYAKYSSAGNLTWAKNIGGASAEAGNGISVDGSGNVYITGHFTGTVDFDPSGSTTNLTSAGSYDIFFAKYDSNGDIVWAKKVGGGSNDNSVAITSDGSTYIYVTGKFAGSGDFDPGAGLTTLTSAGSDDVFFGKYNGSDGLLPVELVSFNGRISDGTVLLTWQTATEVSNFGFEVERKNVNGTWDKRGFIPGHGNSNSPKVYTFTDGGLVEGKAIYRLKQIDTDGSYTYSSEVELSNGVPAEFSLLQNYPNPFNPSTRIEFALPAESSVTLEVLNILGERIAVLLENETLAAGSHSVNFRPNEQVSGIYFYRLITDGWSSIKKMIYMK